MVPDFAKAATYFVSPSGNGTTCNEISRCALPTGLAKLTPGDTLILGDGVYNQRITNVASGSEGAYTIIRAENDGAAIISDGSTTTSSGGVIQVYGMHHVQWEGLRIQSTSDPAIAGNALSGALFINNTSHHNKFLRTAFTATPCVNDAKCINHSTVAISGYNNLIEDSWAWGGGRYKFLIYGGDGLGRGSYNILRRVVIRHDREYSGGFNPQAGVAFYQAGNNILQNVIVLDSDQLEYYDNTNPNCCWYGAYAFIKGTQGASTKLDGSFALHYGTVDSPAVGEGDNTPESLYPVGDVTIKNFVAYHGGQGFTFAPSGHPGSRVLSVDHSFVGNTLSSQSGDYDDQGNGFSAGKLFTDQANNAVATNNIFYQILRDTFAGYALYNVRGPNNYNNFYSNYANYGFGSTVGLNDITNINPLSPSLLYPVRIEPNSPLKGAGSNGDDIGPTILKRIGVSGTLYGEDGYDELTSEDLWPWPNEDRIKIDMSSYPKNWPSDNMPNPVRGFTAGTSLDGSSQTLTKYIWETLGNQIPPEIYNNSLDTTPPAAPSGLNVQ